MQKAAFSSERRNLLPSFSLFFSIFPLPVGNYRQRYPLNKQSGQDRQGHSHFALAIRTSARTTITKVTVNPITNRIISFMGFLLLLLVCRQAVKSAFGYPQLFSGLPVGHGKKHLSMTAPLVCSAIMIISIADMLIIPERPVDGIKPTSVSGQERTVTVTPVISGQVQRRQRNFHNT